MSLFDDMAKAAVADIGNKYQEVVFGQQAPEAVPEQPDREPPAPDHDLDR